MTAAELKSWRQSLGLSQLAAAEALGISRRMYCYYESGQAPIPKTVALACVALRYMPDDKLKRPFPLQR